MHNYARLTPSTTTLIAVLASALPVAGHAATAAHISFTAGDVRALSADGRSRPLVKGAEVASGETIDTGNGRAQMHFSDGAQVSLAPQTQFRIDEYSFAGKSDGGEKGFFSLVKGAMRTITGAIGKTTRQNYRISTTVATIGIRGTEFSVTHGNSINVTTGEGSNEVCNAAGCLVLNSGETAYVADANTRPVMTDKKTEIPPPPASPKLNEIIAGNDTDGEGNPARLGSQSDPGMPIIPLASGSGGLGVAYVTAAGSAGGGLLGGTLTFAPTGELTQFADSTYPLMGYSGGAVADFGADGIIGWGRWIGGAQTDIYGTPTSLAGMSYVASLTSAAVVAPSIIRGYASFASTAPVVVSGGSIVATGAPNSVTGTLNVNFASNPGTGGSLTYSLNIPVAGQTFSVIGSANQYSNTGFLGTSSTISSSGSACLTACSGSIPFGDAIQGMLAGSGAERAGANYGFNSAVGNVSGAIVFK